jgi:hypothetical protein
MFTDYLDAVAKSLTDSFQVLAVVVVISGGFFAYRRFVSQRLTAVRMTLDAKTVSEANGLALVAITVHLENKGDSRIRARRHDGDSKQYLYNDRDKCKVEATCKDTNYDQCEHAGTLKVRAIALPRSGPMHFDWYALKTLSAEVMKADGSMESKDLEQINYLSEYQDPEKKYEDVDCWLERREAYDFTSTVWLRPGTYMAKAFFLGSERRYQEEEYWSCHTVFRVKEELSSGKPGTPQAAR